MNRRYMFIALGLVLLVNAVILIGVARNRSGEPDATLVLSERELPLSWDFRDKENTGVSLQLNVNFNNEELLWFDESKLAELGYNVRRYRESNHARTWQVLPKKAYVVLEYEGEVWQRYRQRQLDEIATLPEKVDLGKLEPEYAQNQIQEKRFQLTVASRLFCIDAGLDPGKLRLRYSDGGRYIIVPAEVRMQIDWEPKSSDQKGVRKLFGRVQKVLVNQLYVPHKLHSQLQALPSSVRIQPGYTYFNRQNPARVRYQVQVAFGQRLEPWILGIKLVNAQELENAASQGK